MYVFLEIQYKAASRATQSGSFPLRGRKPEKVALEFWKQIQKEMSYHANIEKVMLNSEMDITQLVLDLQEQEWNKALQDGLPF